VIDSIERLVGQSILLTGYAAGGMRYRLLAPLREVAGELAEQAGETAELQRRHRDAMLRRAQQVVQQWCGPQQDVLIARMGLDHANYVAALQWSAATEGEEQTGLLLLAALRYHWLSGGLLAEGRMRIETMLAAVGEPSAARAECLWWRAGLRLSKVTGTRPNDGWKSSQFSRSSRMTPGWTCTCITGRGYWPCSPVMWTEPFADFGSPSTGTVPAEIVKWN